MIVFALNTGCRESFGPCGLRLSLHDNTYELAGEVLYFFEEVEDHRNDALEALRELFDRHSPSDSSERLAVLTLAAVEACVGDREWSIYCEQRLYMTSATLNSENEP